jgi:DNA relaxase NicK
MNMMTLQRFRNELILLVAILFALIAFFYKLSANDYVEENRNRIQQEVAEINLINGLKEQWGNKQVGNKLNVLKTIVPNTKIASFNKKSKKLVASYKNLTGNELSKVTNKLINLPVQIVLLNIDQSADKQYTMEFTCKW